MGFHSELDAGAIHVAYNFSYADSTAMNAATVVSADIGKIAWKTDDDTFWILQDTVPTWAELTNSTAGGTISSGGSSTDKALARWNGTAGDTLQDSALVVADSGIVTAKATDAVTAAVTRTQVIGHNSSGTPATSFGTGIELQGESATVENRTLGAFEMWWATATDASRRSASRLLQVYNGTEYERAVFGHLTFATTAGNARGYGSVDLQALRGSATNVASGEYAIILGGASNTASGYNSIVLGGAYNYATYPGAVVLGGYTNYAYTNMATILGGQEALTQNPWQVSRANGKFAANGDAQMSLYVVRRSVTHSTTAWFELYLNGSSERIGVDQDRALVFKAWIIGTTTGNGKTFGFEINGVIKNDAGTTSMLATNTTTIYDTDDTSFDARASADNTNDALLIEVSDSDGASDVVRWVATVLVTEVDFP